ncbi:MAG: sulfite reductase (NADPH) hemoprotein beta-component [Gammaproteobacteria bacterium]|jgi:sulfite reductase (NADPH) hemoprotein beta-component
MYAYSQIDQTLVDERVIQFRDQTTRFLAGKLDEEVYKQLRLRNGLYVQRHAPMLRVAVPYGVLDSTQMRMLANISRIYDKSYAHVTTRQNFQFNWPTIESVPDILADLAKVQMHAIQTSGNCIRNVTSDPLAGAAVDEVEDPRVWCEIIRQWSTLHPEFSYLPRKFKFAVTGSTEDRVALQVHDIGLQVLRNNEGEVGFKVYVGGGMGRTPVIGKVIRDFLPRTDFLSYLDAILRVYNLYGRRDNIYKARIKILVNAIGINKFRDMVEEEWIQVRDSDLKLTNARIQTITDAFNFIQYQDLPATDKDHEQNLLTNPIFSSWCQQNTRLHKKSGYRIVYVSLKGHGQAPGDVNDLQMDGIANLADEFSMGEIRTTYSQNMVLAHVQQTQLYQLWRKLNKLKLATPNIDTVTDLICCPGFDFCSLANATSIDVSEDIMARFEKLDRLYDVGELNIKISGCMNACGHHHVGHIGLLGVDKKGEDWYQITLGGSASNHTALGKVLGPSVEKSKIGDSVEKIIEVYLELRECDENFLQTLARVGRSPFKEQVYVDSD